MNDYTQKIQSIVNACASCGFAIPDGQRFVRFSHERGMFRGKACYLIRYKWTRPYAHHISGFVFEVVIGRGDDFDSALADIRHRQARRERGAMRNYSRK